MKKFLATLLVCCFSQNASLMAYAESYTEGWKFERFHSDIEIQENGSVIITETLVADFSQEAHRGVARYIPYEADGYNTHIQFVSSPGNTNHYKNYDGWMVVELYTPNGQPSTSTETFSFKYRLSNAILFHEQYDEFYWNVNGNDHPSHHRNRGNSLFHRLPRRQRTKLPIQTRRRIFIL